MTRARSNYHHHTVGNRYRVVRRNWLPWPPSPNYVAEEEDGTEEIRDFFVFDLSGVTQLITAATLVAYNPADSIVGDVGASYQSAGCSAAAGRRAGTLSGNGLDLTEI